MSIDNPALFLKRKTGYEVVLFHFASGNGEKPIVSLTIRLAHWHFAENRHNFLEDDLVVAEHADRLLPGANLYERDGDFDEKIRYAQRKKILVS